MDSSLEKIIQTAAKGPHITSFSFQLMPCPQFWKLIFFLPCRLNVLGSDHGALVQTAHCIAIKVGCAEEGIDCVSTSEVQPSRTKKAPAQAFVSAHHPQKLA